MKTTADIAELSARRLSSVNLPVPIELWISDLDSSNVEDFWVTLGVDEKARAKRFHFAKDARRFVVRRGILRQLLSRYLDRPPGSIRFEYNRYGKPTLPGIEFSQSSSAGF